MLREWWEKTRSAYSPEFQSFIREATPTGPLPFGLVNQSASDS
jgi:hypothetical protein